MRSSLRRDRPLRLGSGEPGGMREQAGRWCWVPRSPAHLGSFRSQRPPGSCTDPAPRRTAHPSTDRPGQPRSCLSPAYSPAGYIQPGKGSAGSYEAAAKERGVRSCRSICNFSFLLRQECEGCER